jgi:poly-gamma-glutamate synthesis protein (capsule biosynthesis protein)
VQNLLGKPAPVPHVRRAAGALEASGASLVAGIRRTSHRARRAARSSTSATSSTTTPVDRALRNDLGLLRLVTLDAEGPRRVEGIPVRLDLAHARLAGDVERSLLPALLEERCAAVGSTVHRGDQRLVFDLA